MTRIDPAIDHPNGKNPGCYVFFEENGCKPGDHFSIYDREKARAFLNYRPFEFRQPPIQTVATQVSLLSLIGTVIALLFLSLCEALVRRTRNGA